jgi:hypothetical protein
MGEHVHCLALLGYVSSKMQPRSMLWRILILVGCVIFLESMLNPFLTAYWTGIRIPESHSSWPGEMWSFKQQFYYLRGSLATVPLVELSFGEYWLQDWYNWYGFASWTGFALVLMFSLQVLAIAFGSFAIFKNSRSVILLPALLNSLIAVLMITVFNGMSDGYAKTFHIGFWFTLLSSAQFLLASIIYHFPRRHKDSTAN